jgi:hypothetical protein
VVIRGVARVDDEEWKVGEGMSGGWSRQVGDVEEGLGWRSQSGASKAQEKSSSNILSQLGPLRGQDHYLESSKGR